MAVILAKSVAITKSRLTKGFNGDNLNIGGRVVPLESADKGFKAAGTVDPPYTAVIASGNRKGFAAGAATAFNDYSKNVQANKYNAQEIINKYFDDMDVVVNKCNIPDSKLSIGVLCVFDDCVVAAKTGGCHLLRFSDGELFEIALSEEENGRGYQFIDTVNDGDIFALIGEEASVDLDYDAIVSAFDESVDLKSTIKDIFKILAANSRAQDCSAILVQVAADANTTYAPAAADVLGAAVGSETTESELDGYGENGGFGDEKPIDASELEADEDYVSDDEKPEDSKKPKSRKTAQMIPIIVLVIILAVAAALYFATKPKSNKVKEGESQSASLFSDEKEEGTIDENGSTGMKDVTEPDAAVNTIATPDDDNNNAGNDSNSGNDSDEDDGDDDDNNNDNNNNYNNNSYNEPTTQAPTTAAPTTTPPTTENSGDNTTQAPTTSPDSGNGDSENENGGEGGGEEAGDNEQDA